MKDVVFKPGIRTKLVTAEEFGGAVVEGIYCGESCVLACFLRGFDDDALDAIHRTSRGIPREINNICDVSLLLAFGVKAEEIDGATIQKATQAIKQL